MNVRGTAGQQVLLVWLVFLIVLVVGGLALGASIFYGKGYDYRQAEADTFSYVLTRCLSTQQSVPETLPALATACGFSFSEKDIPLTFSLCSVSCATHQPFIQLGSSLVDCSLQGTNEQFGKCSRSFIVRPEGTFELVVQSRGRSGGTHA